MKNTIITLASVAALAGAVNGQTLNYTLGNDFITSSSNSGTQTGTSNGQTVVTTVTASNGPADVYGNGHLAYPTNPTGASYTDTITIAFSTPVNVELDYTSINYGDFGFVFEGIQNFSTAPTLLVSDGGTVFTGGVLQGTGTGSSAPGGLGNGTLSWGNIENISFLVRGYRTPGGGGSTSNNSFTLAGLRATAVPEPSSTALLGLGGLALILRRRK